MENEELLPGSEITENTEESLLSDDGIALTATYYDSYYDEVLNSLNEIKTNENTIIENQETIIGCHQTQSSYFIAILFVICLAFILNSMRHMINVK